MKIKTLVVRARALKMWFLKFPVTQLFEWLLDRKFYYGLIGEQRARNAFVWAGIITKSVSPNNRLISRRVQ